MFLQELSLTNMITDLHLLVIHFPIALLSIAVLFDFLFYFTRRDDLISASWWTCYLVSFLALLLLLQVL